MDKSFDFWEFETWRIDRRNGELLSQSDQRESLEGREFAVLDFLISNRGEFFSPKDLIDEVWPSNTFVEPNNAEQAITRIRKKFENLGLRGEEIIERKRGTGFRFVPTPVNAGDDYTRTTSQRLPEALRQRIGELSLRSKLKRAVRQVLTAGNYPVMMTLSSEPVLNPIWRFIPDATRTALATTFSPFGDLPPRIMHLDIFLLRANDKLGRPRLLNYFSGKPITGWQAFMLPFRNRRPGENESVRQRENSKDMAEFLGLPVESVHVASLGDQFVVSVKPDPGYSELVTYIFEFCSVRFEVAPEWLRSVDCTLTLDTSARRFRWLHPEEMERQERSMLVDGDVIRGVHYFFGTTLPAIPVGFPVMID